MTRSEGFVERALALYPSGGSADGTPSFELFESGPLRGVEELFARAFDDQPEAVEGTGIRFAMTHGVPVFPAMVFYGCLGTDGGVELLDVIRPPRLLRPDWRRPRRLRRRPRPHPEVHPVGHQITAVSSPAMVSARSIGSAATARSPGGQPVDRLRQPVDSTRRDVDSLRHEVARLERRVAQLEHQERLRSSELPSWYWVMIASSILLSVLTVVVAADAG